VADVGVANGLAQVDVVVEQLPQPEVLSQGGGQDEPRIGDLGLTFSATSRSSSKALSVSMT